MDYAVVCLFGVLVECRIRRYYTITLSNKHRKRSTEPIPTRRHTHTARSSQCTESSSFSPSSHPARESQSPATLPRDTRDSTTADCSPATSHTPPFPTMSESRTGDCANIAGRGIVTFTGVARRVARRWIGSVMFTSSCGGLSLTPLPSLHRIDGRLRDEHEQLRPRFLHRRVGVDERGVGDGGRNLLRHVHQAELRHVHEDSAREIEHGGGATVVDGIARIVAAVLRGDVAGDRQMVFRVERKGDGAGPERTMGERRKKRDYSRSGYLMKCPAALVRVMAPFSPTS